MGYRSVRLPIRDTSYSDDGDRTGPGWSEYMRPTGGFRLRHPLGLLNAG